MREHLVASFDEALERADRLISDMGDLAGKMVAAATYALLTSDLALAERVIADDAAMDAKQREVDDHAITVIATRQPMAQDLRAILSAIRMAGDLERIGDLAKNIAKRVSAVGDHSMPRNPSHSVDTMSRLVLSQVHGIVEKYVSRDAEGLRQLWANDEKVDLEYVTVSRELLAYMVEDPRNITACTHLLFCAKNLERIGDHVTNIAEYAYFMMTGAQLPADRPKVDETLNTDDRSS